MTAPPIYIQSLSDWAVLSGDRALPIASKKANALLAYLVFSDRYQFRREELASLLWPKAEAKTARASLRQTLFSLRKGLGAQGEPFLTVAKDLISVNHGCIQTDCDRLIFRLEKNTAVAVTQAQLAQVKPDQFLNGFEDLEDEFYSWIVEQRSRLEARFLRASKVALTARAAAPEVLRDIAKAVLSIDEYDEQAVRTLMRHHKSTGEHPAALRIYGDLYQRLSDTMDAEPSPETQRLAVEIKLQPAPRQPSSVSAQPRKAPEAFVAILPFEERGVPNLDSLVTLGLLDEITCHLAQLQAISVISSNSTRQYLSQSPSPTQVQEDLGAHYAVFGTIRTSEGRSAIRVQIVECATQKVIETRVHDCNVKDIVALTSEIGANIANSLVPYLSHKEIERTRDLPLEALDHYLIVLRAKEKIFQLSRDALDDAGQLLDEAVAVAPRFAQAQALKAECHAIRIWQRWSDDLGRERNDMEAALARAIALSGSDPQILAFNAYNQVLMHHRFEQAEKMLDQALRVAPNDAQALAWSVPVFSFSGQVDRAVETGRRVLRLSPVDPFLFRNLHFLSIALYTSGAYEEAAELGQRCYFLNPNYVSNIRMTVAASYACQNDAPIAEMLERHNTLVPDFSLNNYGSGPPFRDLSIKHRLIDHLKAAGLPV